MKNHESGQLPAYFDMVKQIHKSQSPKPIKRPPGDLRGKKIPEEPLRVRMEKNLQPFERLKTAIDYSEAMR